MQPCSGRSNGCLCCLKEQVRLNEILGRHVAQLARKPAVLSSAIARDGSDAEANDAQLAHELPQELGQEFGCRACDITPSTNESVVFACDGREVGDDVVLGVACIAVLQYTHTCSRSWRQNCKKLG